MKVIHLSPLPAHPDAQVEVTLRMMIRLTVAEAFSSEVRWAIYHSSIAHFGDEDAARAACEWVRANVAFSLDPEEVELLRTPSSLIAAIRARRPGGPKPKGDCDDLGLLLGTILYAQGIPVRYVTISTSRDNPNFRHLFIEAWLRGAWRALDPSVSRPYRTDGLRHRYFPVPSSKQPPRLGAG